MATNETINSENPLETSGSGSTPVPLEQLIAEIDGDTGQSSEPVPEQSGETRADIENGVNTRGQYIRFFLEDILLAIPLSSALEIGHWPEITPLPNLPDWVLGVSNIRGEIVSMVDLKAFFGIPSPKLIRNRRFIIAKHKDMKVGLIVDRIMGILYLDRSESDIRTSPYEHGEISSYISGVVASEEILLNILDIEKLLASSRMNAFTAD